MSGSPVHPDVERDHGIKAVHQAMNLLKEHWQNIEINVVRTSANKEVSTYCLESGNEEEEA